MPIVITVLLYLVTVFVAAVLHVPPWIGGGVMVVLSSIWAAADARRLDGSAGSTLLGCLLLWVVFFPMYLYERRALKAARDLAESADDDSVREGSSFDLPRAPLPTERAATTRACPECGEVILGVARKCKHCGSAVNPNDPMV